MDCTLGGGGHTRAILEAGGLVIGIDQDPEAIARASEVCRKFIDIGHLEIFQTNFHHAAHTILTQSKLFANGAGGSVDSSSDSTMSDKNGGVDGVLMDLGVSSYQIDQGYRGFAFGQNGPLDMRMHQQTSSPSSAAATTATTSASPFWTAKDIVNSWDSDDIASVLKTYGDETNANAIAKQIVLQRPMSTTTELVEAISRVTPWKRRNATLARCFQALRIAINDEMTSLQQSLELVHTYIKPGGRLVVLSYHSLEDRLIKNFMRNNPVNVPVPNLVRPVPMPMNESSHLSVETSIPHSITRSKVVWESILKKALLPTEEEIVRNSRARSAKLRCAVPSSGANGRAVTGLK